MNETIQRLWTKAELLELKQYVINNDLKIWENLLDKCSQIQHIRISIVIICFSIMWLLFLSYRNHKRIMKLEGKKWIKKRKKS